MSDPSYPVFPIFAFLGFVLALIPLPWHLQAWNSGTCLYMIWTALACLNQFVNSIVWHGNALDVAPVWCDISSRLMIGTAVAIPAASLCINRRLYKIATVSTVSISRGEKRRAILVDLAIGLGIPVVQMVLQYVVQGHRYDIYEDIGCFPFTFNTPLAYPLVLLWPIIIGLISAVYCALTLRAFLKRRSQFSEFITSHSSLTVNRYFRLMALASADLLCTVPYSAYGTYLDLTAAPLSPWRGWADAHFDFAKVNLIPAVLWRPNHQLAVSLELSRWLLPVCAIIFFAFFGFALEARKNYAAVWKACTRRIPLRAFRRSDGSSRVIGLVQSSSKQTGVLPIYVARPPPSQTFISCDSTSTFKDDKLPSP